MKRRDFYFFGDGKAEGRGDMKDELGGKGAGLAEMSRARVPVPPGFTIATHVCIDYLKNGGKLPKSVDAEMKKYLKKLESSAGRKLGEAKKPLLVSVRSGARVSMPGMMDTILNLGLNDKTVEGLAAETSDERFAYDCYRRFIMMFSDVVLDVPKDEFEKLLRALKSERGIESDLDLTPQDLRNLAAQFKTHCLNQTGNPFPQDVWKQLTLARDAVFRSWKNKRAFEYRRLNKIPDHIGTACNVQAMVFGNSGPRSGTGVGFTRDPSTGDKTFYGEFLANAQGEDVVAGVRTPDPITKLEETQPRVFKQLQQITARLEKHYRDMQDFEFTVQDGRLFMLQTRSGKRTGHAALKVAVDMVKEKLITREEAVLRVEPGHIEQLLHPIFDPAKRSLHRTLARGLNASPGAASGRVVFDADKAVDLVSQGERVLLVRAETSPDDIHGMAVARGILTGTGGLTSHAAVVSRQMGKPSVVGCSSLKIESGRMVIGDQVVDEGEYISVDGSSGEVLQGDVPTMPSDVIRVLSGQKSERESDIFSSFSTFFKWVDKARRLRVRANADTSNDARLAIALGAEGIGLCRTEHMFFAEERVPIMQRMILAKEKSERESALAELLPLQREDFRSLFETMGKRPVTIRTLDPPLHEFLPKREELMVEVTQLKMGGSDDSGRIDERQRLLERVEELHEFNPMMGLRGCRLGILMPEITQMQARAIIEAALEVPGIVPEIMIPLVGNVGELRNQKKIVDDTAQRVFEEKGRKCRYLVGTMIEIPRAALTADEIAVEAEFFSFGTNDLTQMTCGFSRDDAGKFLPLYVNEAIYKIDPFVAIDRTGVGHLMKIAVQRGRETRPHVHLGICGEHGGEPSSVEFCHELGLDYVSCSPYRLPVARLAAAQASLKEGPAGKKAKPKPKQKKRKRK